MLEEAFSGALGLTRLDTQTSETSSGEWRAKGLDNGLASNSPRAQAIALMGRYFRSFKHPINQWVLHFKYETTL